MAEAFGATATPIQRIEPTDQALRLLWAQREDIKILAQKSLRVAKFHADMQRAPFNERQMARETQQRCITLLAHIDDIEKAATARKDNSGGGG